MSPIAVDALLRGTADDGSNPSRVLGLLRAQPDQAWRAIEIAEALDIEQHTLGAVLRRLRTRGLVDKRGAYWFVPSPRDQARLMALHAVTHELNARLGPEDPDQWPRVR